MEISDISLEMELNGVDAEDISAILEACKTRGYEGDIIDQELSARGYEPIFTIDYDSYNEWDDGEYTSVEKIRHKEQYR